MVYQYSRASQSSPPSCFGLQGAVAVGFQMIGIDRVNSIGTWPKKSWNRSGLDDVIELAFLTQPHGDRKTAVG